MVRGRTTDNWVHVGYAHKPKIFPYKTKVTVKEISPANGEISEK